MPAVIFSGDAVKTLKDKLKIGENLTVLSGTLDPRQVATDAPQGSLYLHTTKFIWFRKLDAGSTTNWELILENEQPVNFIKNPDGEFDTVGWANYQNAAGVAPVDGTGGAPGTVISRASSSLMDGSWDLIVLNGDLSNRQGKGGSYEFTIDPKDQGRELPISFTYFNNANAGDDFFRIYIYDITNGQLITPVLRNLTVPKVPVSTSVAKWTSSFWAASNSTSYRLIVHIATTSTANYLLQLTDVTVGRNVLFQGPIVSPWQDYNLVITADTTAPTTGAVAINKASWRRVGDTAEIRWEFSQTSAGTAGSGTYKFSLPSVIADALKISGYTGNAYQVLGAATAYATAPGTVFNGVVQLHTDLSNFVITGNNSANRVSNSLYDLSNASVNYGVEFRVPIEGWDSGAFMSTTEINNLVGSVKYETNASQSIPTAVDTLVDFEDKVWDDNGAVTVGTWKWTAWKPGRVQVNSKVLYSATTNWNAGEIANLKLYKNGAAYAHLDYKTIATTGVSQLVPLKGTGKVDVAQGDYLQIYAYQNTGSALTLVSDAKQNYVDIAYEPDFSVYGVFGVNEQKAIVSSTKTPPGSGQFAQMTGNNIELTPGRWMLITQGELTQSGGNPQYLSVLVMLASANGADTGSVPAGLSSNPNLTLVTGSFFYQNWITGITGAGDYRLPGYPVVVDVHTTTDQIYSVPYQASTTPANARLRVYITAVRLQ